MEKTKEEYFYIDFNNCDICSYMDENTKLDKSNKFIGKNFGSFIEAKNFLKQTLKNNK